MVRLRIGVLSAVAVAALVPAFVAPVLAAPAPAQSVRPASPRPSATPTAVPTITPEIVEPSGQPSAGSPSAPAVPLPIPEPVMAWPLGDAQALLGVIESIDAEGLIPADYKPDDLRSAIAAGPGPGLDATASRAFSWLAEDLRDGRTPMEARVQWFAVDPDQETAPTLGLMGKALETHDVAGVLAGLAPIHLDYQTLKAALGATPKTDKATRALIRANMDRWRWLTRDLGTLYLIANVPEFQLRLMVRDRIIRHYRTVVGKPGRTATPQLAERVEAVVFNPTWTVPQSIVVGEGLGASLLRAPRAGYKVTRAANGTLSVVQQPGPSNALGLMKIDMPNPHAIYLHDTPSKQYFNQAVRAESHGCIRTERAVELGMTMGILGAGLTQEQAAQNSNSGKYMRVPMTRTFPVYISYFTMGRNLEGRLTKFGDIYGRDKPVIDSFAQPRQAKTTQRTSDEPVIQLDNPL